MSFRFIDISKPLHLQDTACPDNINIIYQFFIPDDKHRYKEIKECLMHNIKNKFVNNVILFNERDYSLRELGLQNFDKVTQINLGKRLTFAETFRQIKERDIEGYNVIINSDIFVDDTINKLRFSQLKDHNIVLEIGRASCRERV